MKKKLISMILASLVLGAAVFPAVSFSFIINDSMGTNTSSALGITSQIVQPRYSALVHENSQKMISTVIGTEPIPVLSENIQSNVQTQIPISRGGYSPQHSDEQAISQSKTFTESRNEKKSNIELLDWWKQAQYIFSKNTTAKVTDIYTGKTFNVRRTMGTNHADCEALTKEDTDIIKSIWGGFSWDRRPVIVNVDGRQLAASMSAMPHAGLDSAPSYDVVNNRSDGYGRGENLDIIKGNGMDGHFDIHFLNSTRHKDGKKDPEHQAAILKAAGK